MRAFPRSLWQRLLRIPCSLVAIAFSFTLVVATALLGLVLEDLRDQFLDAALGFDGAPVHYPRPADDAGDPSAPRDKLYEWFVANERGKHFRSLPASGADSPPTLPYLKK
ncbi:hypothetical protein [Skermania piniformis]|uniref:ABC transporter permease n=1 Tax=Skermania pinensis TaxID=39122 RepID=A0ABX8SC12_9ACTN|nr:hypothetical protein [Skermania piniformis]QXQ14507.1 hypothetical protein KV203_03620 [Skermania piniformis]